MKSKKTISNQKSRMQSIRSYLNENMSFFAMAGASFFGDERSAEYLAKLTH